MNNDDDIYKQKSFWWTLCIGTALFINPAVLLIPATIYGIKAGTYACKALGRALRTGFGSIQEFSRQRRLHAIQEADDEAYERAAPERQRVAAERAQQQKRKDDARTACELLYLQHAHILRNRLPAELFQELIERHLSDAHSADHVEARGRQLQQLVMQHIHQIEPPERPYSLQSLADWYKATKTQIEDLPIDDRYKQAQLAQLNARYAELMQGLFEDLQP